MDELTLLAVAEVIKAEAGVAHHRISIPAAKMASLAWSSSNARSSLRPEGRTPKKGKTGGHHETGTAQ
jgi:hypothetical protein